MPNGFHTLILACESGCFECGSAGKYNDVITGTYADKILLINGLDNHAEVHKDGPGDACTGEPQPSSPGVHPLKHASNIPGLDRASTSS